MYDMKLYQSKRAEVAQYSDQQLIFRALAMILSEMRPGSGYSFEFTQAVIDDLLRRAETPPPITQPADNEQIFRVLVMIYKESITSAAVVGRICDEVLDRSGGLLGRVRNAAMGE